MVIVHNVVRALILLVIEHTGYCKQLMRRVNFTAIGFTGYISMMDKTVIREEGLKPLNKFERWLLKDIITFEQERRRAIFAEVIERYL